MSYKKLKIELTKKLKLLSENPFMYQKIEKSKANRRFFIQKYVIIYEIREKYIIIKRILPQKKNYNSKTIYKQKSIK